MAIVEVDLPVTIDNSIPGEGVHKFLKTTYPAFTGLLEKQGKGTPAEKLVFHWNDSVAPTPIEALIVSDHATWLAGVQADTLAKQTRKDFARDNHGVGGLPALEARVDNLVEVLQDLGVIPT